MDKTLIKCEINEVPDVPGLWNCNASSNNYRGMYRMTPNTATLKNKDYYTFCYECTESLYYYHDWDFYADDMEKARKLHGRWPDKQDIMNGVHPKGIISEYEEPKLEILDNKINETIIDKIDTQSEHNDSYLAVFDLMSNQYDDVNDSSTEIEAESKQQDYNIYRNDFDWSFFEMLNDVLNRNPNTLSGLNHAYRSNLPITQEQLDFVDESFPALILYDELANISARKFPVQSILKQERLSKKRPNRDR